MRVLIVEDDPKIASFVAKGLKQAGYAVDRAANGQAGLELARSAPYDAAIVDIMLPRLDGLALIERLRAEGVRIPVLILSARHSVDDKVRGFQTGGDDYLTKPFSFEELQARVQALIRRATMSVPASRLEVGDLSLDLARREVRRGDQLLELQPREYSLLEYLLRSTGMVVSKTMILEHVWDYHFDPQTNVVDVLVHRLRAKIDEGFEPKLLHTVRGVGYVLKVP
ncbi:MAG: DNA-binding response regulator [Spirochaetes bacterium RBG_16_67_19]|nr:MAG: DNA-binding response regulator [Spirochaetes bacterium GWB1_66_5]OHD72490.1 MAG: DNA-binding response regulator [Spirochaetes bacterium RBG_16_67_19]